MKAKSTSAIERRLGDGELISTGEEILTRAHVLGEAMVRRVRRAVQIVASEQPGYTEVAEQPAAQ
jgi:hypothetical protein